MRRLWKLSVSCSVLGIGSALMFACGSSPSDDCAASSSCVPQPGSDAGTVDGSTADSAPSPDGSNGCFAPASLSCSGTCVDPSDPAHCGSCTTTCSGDTPLCQPTSGSYACVSSCAAPTPNQCGSTCTDTSKDPKNCGSCQKACPGAANATATCANSVCGTACNSGYHSCNGACADDKSVNSCGSTSCTPCTAPPNATATCDGTKCGFTCGSGYHACGNACADNSSLNSCGAMCTPCAVPPSGHGTPTCDGTSCGVTCTSGYHACKGDCLSDGDDPSGDACVIGNAYGVFVSANGSDSGAGTMASPFKTLGHAIDVAVGGKKRVYACASAGAFTENLVVSGGRDGVTVFGGLDCSAATWSYNGAKTTLAPTAQGYALQLSGLNAGATFEDFAFVAQPGSSAAPNSIAVFATSAQNVVFRRVTISADNGAPGAPGSAGASNHFGGSLDGNTASGATGAPNKTCACPDSTSSVGGSGGDSSNAATPGKPFDGGGANGQNANACNGVGSGGDGANATANSSDAPSSAHGALSASGWTPALGAAGSNGKPGQGGGGGGDGKNNSGGGGGGACGGCGGAGAKPGVGGGSSIALLSFQSGISLFSSNLAARNGGVGGSGGGGEVGQTGGNAGVEAAGGCNGGGGGNGAGGNGGQGGPGGLSLCIGYSGSAPSADGTTTVTVGQPGSGGQGGTGGSGVGAAGASGAKGADGIASTTATAL